MSNLTNDDKLNSFFTDMPDEAEDFDGDGASNAIDFASLDGPEAFSETAMEGVTAEEQTDPTGTAGEEASKNEEAGDTGAAENVGDSVEIGDVSAAGDDSDSGDTADGKDERDEAEEASRGEKAALRKERRRARRSLRKQNTADTIQAVKQVKKEIELDDRKLKETSESTRRFLLGLAAVVVVAAVVIFLFSDRFYNSVQGKSSYVLKDTGLSLTYTEGSTTLLIHDGNMLRCSQDGLLALSSKGDVVYDIPFTMSSPYIVTAGDYISVADRLGMAELVIKDGKTVASVTTESNILLNTVNEVGETAVALISTNGHTINLYSADGEVMMQRRTYSTTDGIPMALALSEDGSRMATAYVNYTGSELQSIITIFDLTETGSSLVDRIVGSAVYSETVISDIKFVDDMLFYLGTDSFGELTTQDTVEVAWETELSYEIKSMGLGDGYFAILYGDGMAGTATEAEYNIVAYNFNGEVMNQMYVENVSYMDVWADVIIYGTGREYYGVSSTGKPKWSLNSGETFTRLIAYDNGKTVAVTQNGLIRFYQVTLRGAEINDEYGD